MARKKKSTPNAVNQTEVFIKSAVSGNTMTPITQTEKFVADVINKEEVTPKTHDEKFIKWAIENSSGETPVLIEKTITENGEYLASSDNATGYSKVTAGVPNTYTVSDEGKVVSDGALVTQTSETYTANGTYDTTTIGSVTVNVSGTAPTGGTLSITNNSGTWVDVIRSWGGTVGDGKIRVWEEQIVTNNSTISAPCSIAPHQQNHIACIVSIAKQSSMTSQKFSCTSTDCDITELGHVDYSSGGKIGYFMLWGKKQGTTGSLTFTIVNA